MSAVTIEARKREEVGTRAAKKFRREGWVPGVFYSHGKPAESLLFNLRNLGYFLARGHGLVDLQIEGSKTPLKCVLKEVQYHPVSEKPIHADFMGVTMGEKLTVMVPLALKGTPRGAKQGGILQFLVREVQVQCLPTNIPQTLEIDVEPLEVGDAFHVGDLKLDNIEILDDPNETILTVELPKRVISELDEAAMGEGEAEEAGEGEGEADSTEE